MCNGLERTLTGVLEDRGTPGLRRQFGGEMLPRFSFHINISDISEISDISNISDIPYLVIFS